MKRYMDLTQEELLAAGQDDKQVELLIELEIMHAALVPVEAPVDPRVQCPPLKPTIKMYGVGGLYFSKPEDAEAVVALRPARTDYDYSIGSQYKYLDTIKEFSVDAVLLYDRTELGKIQAQLKVAKATNDAYESALNDFTSYKDKLDEIRNSVIGAIDEARRMARTAAAAAAVLARYTEMSAGDAKIARTFFRSTYKDDPDIISAVLGDLAIEPDQEVEEFQDAISQA